MNPRELQKYPGFLIRRMQQVSVSLFLDCLREYGVTPLQYTIMRNIHADPGIDQNTVAARARLDASTVKDIIRRLEQRGLAERRTDPGDRRKRAVSLTAEGARILGRVEPAVRRSQRALLAPLSSADQNTMLELLTRLLQAHEARLAESDTPAPWKRLGPTDPL